MKSTSTCGPALTRAALVVASALFLFAGPRGRAAEPSPPRGTDKPSVSWLAAAFSPDAIRGLLAAVAAIPPAAGGVIFLANYLTGRGRLMRDKQIFESQKVTLDLIEQIVRIETLRKTADSPFADQQIADAYKYATDDFYSTLIALRANVQIRGAAHAAARNIGGPDLRFRDIRKLPAWRRYFVVPRPRTAWQIVVTGLYYYVAMVIAVAMLIVIPAAAGQFSQFNVVVDIILALLFIALPIVLGNLLLRWIWGRLFRMRENYEAKLSRAYEAAGASTLASAPAPA